VERIGYPDSQSFIAGRVVCTWTTASTIQTVSWPTPSPPVLTLPTPYYSNHSETETRTLRFPCTLRVDTNGSGTILQLSWEGKARSCAPPVGH
jgi:hypothetical protein